MADLVDRSIEIILKNQSDSGAYLACPNFPPYQYCWFRDGSYIAYAMDYYGQPKSAARFHNWAARVINDREDIILRAIEKTRSGLTLDVENQLHTRYTLDGKDGDDGWPNFQLDGFGTWLWTITGHIHQYGVDGVKAWENATNLVADYLSVLWCTPSYDCWEEYPDEIHAYSLGTIYAGLASVQKLSGRDFGATLTEILDYLQEHMVWDCHFVKHSGSKVVDASLLGLAVPYEVFPSDDARIVKTIAQIESTLRENGGVHRYPEDSYYGGGEWILLAGWLGLYYAKIGELDRARTLQGWIESQADSDCHLAEQIPTNLIRSEKYQDWIERWGEIASPLLWSHAKYLLLTKALESK